MTGAISREELQMKIDRRDPVTVVDALEEEYYRHSHIPGAVNIPPERVQELAPKLLPDKSAEVVTYCMSPLCPLSRATADALRQLGYTNVREFPGGKQEWLSAGLPVEGESHAAVHRSAA
jgi:rhodanese-related sulfurtransferase